MPSTFSVYRSPSVDSTAARKGFSIFCVPRDSALEHFRHLRISFATQKPNSRHTHPKIFRLEARNPRVRRAHLVQIVEERVQIVQTADALVQRFHHLVGVLGQLLGVGLLFARLQVTEVAE